MKLTLSRSIAVGIVVLAALPAFCGEVAVLRNGFTIQVDRKEVRGDITRLYFRGGFVDVPSTDIASYEQEPDDPPPPADPPATANVPAVQTPAATAAQAQAANPAAPPVVAALGTNPTGYNADIDQIVHEISSRYRLDPDFVSSVIKAESNYKVRAVSPKGAQGLMQLMPGTAAQLGVTNAFDPKSNVEGGTAYLNWLLEKYHDDPIKALAAYNAGAHRVEQYHGVPPYFETRAYVARIVRDFNAKKRAQMKAAASAPSTQTSAGAAAANSDKSAASPTKTSKKRKAKPATQTDGAAAN